MPTPLARALAHTARGQAWITQFDDDDREIAQRVLDALTLISHSAFERSLTGLIETRAKSMAGPVALFATREVDLEKSYFEQAANLHHPDATGAVNAVGAGSDLGSEARVAALVRNLCRQDPGRLLNHPSVEQMRTARVRAIFVVDDILASGTRTANFVHSLWREATLKSWHSFGWLQFECLAYTATELGEKTVGKLTLRPAVHLFQSCPTFSSMPWSTSDRDQAEQLFRTYAKRTSRPKMPLGYKDTAVSLVFEHGCPNNAPAVFWARTTPKSAWIPMFPARSVLSAEATAFPPELTRPESRTTLERAGQKRLARSAALKRPGPLGEEIILLLALIAKGVRRRSALAHALGLSTARCAALVERCSNAGLVGHTLRITAQGRAELEHSRVVMQPDGVPALGEDSYYPTQLRGTHGG
jgi:hypothetical protein